MRLVFMGTPTFAARILENVAPHHEVVAAYTRPDAVRGRSKRLMPSPVKVAAQSLKIPVLSPRSLRDAEVQQELAALAPDAICVAAYGAILPPEVLAIPRFGCVNVHASQLPRWRGAAPVERAILAGDDTVGVCVMRMEEGLDTGPYCVVRTTEALEKNATELTEELADLGSQALLTALSAIEAGTVAWTEQDPFFATYANKVEKHEFYLAPAMGARDAALTVRASSAAHPARCVVAGRTGTVTRLSRVTSRLLREEVAAGPGQLRWHKKRLYLGFADQPAELLEFKPDGKRAMGAASLAAGLRLPADGFGTWGPIDAQA